MYPRASVDTATPMYCFTVASSKATFCGGARLLWPVLVNIHTIYIYWYSRGVDDIHIYIHIWRYVKDWEMMLLETPQHCYSAWVGWVGSLVRLSGEIPESLRNRLQLLWDDLATYAPYYLLLGCLRLVLWLGTFPQSYESLVSGSWLFHLGAQNPRVGDECWEECTFAFHCQVS